jgi:hypothetical protein
VLSQCRSAAFGSSITIGGRADYLITKGNVSKAEYLNKILCVIEIQSRDGEELCQLQMQVYLLILMNTKHLHALVGFLIFKNGLCQAFKATIDEAGGCIFEMNDRFHICYLCTVMVDVLEEVGLIDKKRSASPDLTISKKAHT